MACLIKCRVSTEWKLEQNGGENMKVYRTKYLAMLEAQADEQAIKVEGGYMLVSRMEMKRWKRR